MGMRTRFLVGLAMAAAAGTTWGADGISAQSAFSKLKGMAGTWTVEPDGHHGGPDVGTPTITYKVTGGGKVVMETYFPGSDHEMVTMYHLDGDELRATHYCAAGNQPRLKLDRAASTADKLVFAFDGGSNLDPTKDVYIAGGTFQFGDDPKAVVAVWDALKGPEKFHSETFRMHKQK